ncbi:MAG: thioredoxin domain-containing protein [Candidatus Cyclonatronum sp.]|uniref:thioredoxin domain-containing protein n=1 Tax=Cyclonatronum sp. TaxID=3024185 RepID=UPI0025BEB118|nr:thioredoxin domain-containing protein [Cyclonatronum sp.]MCC5934879.1 thioredoxin domain-containing protein [Balneolales bacterium]MCH8487142.1 thioredoxin domain-containing protein [Cyclonatronum sp.]
MPNRLAQSGSPYLRQHADNPVDWHPWGEEALVKARRENKMIFLSVGYSSCHWCHVMERETFRDEETAALLNEHFVSIKVDREERPDIDALYMEAVQAISGQGGWPLNVWLTPDTLPVFGGTYFPPTSHSGRPSFRKVLRRMVELYEGEPETIFKQAEELRTALQQDILRHLEAGSLQEKYFEEAVVNLLEQYDEVDGGFSGAPKFPMAMSISFLFKYSLISGKKPYAKPAHHSLKAMLNGGIFDQIGGGFHRYSTDTRWHVPHFEKMLYDNALLISSLSDAHTLKPEPLYELAAEETFRFLRYQMCHPGGGFFAALDADSDGEEGLYYVWSLSETLEALSGFPQHEARFFCDVYNISAKGNWEGTNILHITTRISEIARSYGFEETEARNILYRCREVMLTARADRERPALDDKIITAWNAMLLTALCKAARRFSSPKWETYARQLGDFLAYAMIPENGPVMRLYIAGEVSQPGFLDDYALLAEAMTHLFELSGEARWLTLAEALCNQLIDHFYDDAVQGFHYTAKHHERIIKRGRDIFDNASPSGNSAAIAALWRCGKLTGNTRMEQIANGAFRRVLPAAAMHPSSFSYLLSSALEFFYHNQEIVISGSDPGSFLQHFRQHPSFTRFLVTSPDAAQIPYPPFEGKNKAGSQTLCYICENFSCQKPVSSAESL